MVDDQIGYSMHLINRGIGVRLANSTASNVLGVRLANSTASNVAHACGWRAMHAVRLGHWNQSSLWLRLEPGRKLRFPSACFYVKRNYGEGNIR